MVSDKAKSSVVKCRCRKPPLCKLCFICNTVVRLSPERYLANDRVFCRECRPFADIFLEALEAHKSHDNGNV